VVFHAKIASSGYGKDKVLRRRARASPAASDLSSGAMRQEPYLPHKRREQQQQQAAKARAAVAASDGEGERARVGALDRFAVL
jgi:hypothetical protein